MPWAAIEWGKNEIDIICSLLPLLTHFGCFISTYNLERAITNKWGPAGASLQQPLRVNCLLPAHAPAEWCMVSWKSAWGGLGEARGLWFKPVPAFVRSTWDCIRKQVWTKLCYFKIQEWIRDIWWAYRVIQGGKSNGNHFPL